MKTNAKLLVSGADVANRRILRLALGTSLSLAFSQMINWPMSFIAAVFTMFLLAVPLPAPGLKTGFKFVLAMMIPVYGSMLLLPFLEHYHWTAVLLLAPALFGVFYYSASGGSPIMGMFMTMGLTMVVTVGSVSIDVFLVVANGLGLGAISGMMFVWIAHALLPDLPFKPPGAGGMTKPQPPPPSLPMARRSALRSMTVVFPLAFIFMFMSSSTSYVAVMIKVSSMGQQANASIRREMGKTQLESTLWGGLGAVIAWQVLSIWPSLLMYCLLIGLAGLFFGRQVFQGPGMNPKGGMWSYAFLTMIILLAPAVMDGQGGSNAGTAFYSRLGLFLIIAVYGTVSVAIFDAFWPAPKTAALKPVDTRGS